MIVAGSGPGAEPCVRTFDARTFALLADVAVFEPGFRGGVFVG